MAHWTERARRPADTIGNLARVLCRVLERVCKLLNDHVAPTASVDDPFLRRVLVTKQKHEAGAALPDRPVGRERHHHHGKTADVAALARERHPLIVRKFQPNCGRTNTIIRFTNRCTACSGGPVRLQ